MSMFKQYMKLLENKNFAKEKEQINQENRIGLDLIIISTFIFLMINVVLNVVIGHNLIHRVTLYLELLYFCLVLAVYFPIVRKKNANFTMWLYILEIPVLLIAMFDAVYYEPTKTTFIFMIFLLLFPMFILDRPWRIFLLILSMAILYAVVACTVEPWETYIMDMVHLVNVSVLGIGSSLFFSTVRLRMIQYANRNAELAERDPLTGLYNRSGAEHYVDPKAPGIFIFLDLDKFKGVNDEFGHEEGDHTLQETAAVLRENFRRSDVMIRFGGDEFAVFAPGDWSYDEVEKKMNDLLLSIQKIVMEGSRETMTASIGCAYAPHGTDSLGKLIRVSDRAMYEAKKNGKNGFRIVTI